MIWAWQNIFHTENKNQMRWGVEVIGWLNIYIYIYIFLTACTAINFFFRIVKICVLSLLFWVYNVYINQFFLPYCKNLCAFFVLFTACTSIIFFSRIIRIYILFLVYCVHINNFFLSYGKNLCTFFTFFLVYSVHINHFFLFYCKNLYTFFVFFGLQRAY